MKNSVNKMNVGAWNALPHYSVVGKSTKFYVWVHTPNDTACQYCASEWIIGRVAFDAYNKLTKLFSKDKQAFVELVLQLHTEHNKNNDHE